MTAHFPQLHLLLRLSLLHCKFVARMHMILFLGSHFCSFFGVFVSIPKSNCFNYYSFVIQFKVRAYDASIFFSFPQGYLGVVLCQINILMFFYCISLMKAKRILIGILFNLYIILDNIVILMVLVFPSHENKMLTRHQVVKGHRSFCKELKINF